MALKRHFSQDEKFGLTEEEIKISERFLRKNKTAGAVADSESMKLYELFMLGYSFNDIQQQYPQYSVPQIILTAALRGWCKDREKMNGSLRDRIQAKVVKSIIEQVDFLTTMLSVTNVQHMDVMRKYILDPANNPIPAIIVQNIKEYKEVAETLHKLVAGVSPGTTGKKNAMMDVLAIPPKAEKQNAYKPQVEVIDIRELDRANAEDDE
jgi:glutaredoxin